MIECSARKRFEMQCVVVIMVQFRRIDDLIIATSESNLHCRLDRLVVSFLGVRVPQSHMEVDSDLNL